MRHRLFPQFIIPLILMATIFATPIFCQAHKYQSDKSSPATDNINSKTVDSGFTLTAEEKNYLNHKKVIKVCIDPDWMPLEKIKNGKHIGMTAEYITILEVVIGIPIVMLPTKDWNESITFAKTRKCDIFSLAMPTPERRTYMNFTKPYLSIPLVMAARTSTPFIDNMSLITGQKIGIVKGYAFNEILRQRFPEMQITDVASVQDGLTQVVNNKLFGFVGTLATVGYSIQKDFVGELKVAGKFDERWELGIGTRNDEPLLQSIFDKAITSITPETHQRILNNWIAVRFDQQTDYTIIIQIMLLALIGFAILHWRNLTLKNYNQKLQEQNFKIKQQAEALQKTEDRMRSQQKMEAVGLMAGGVAHDLNNILSGIISYPELILMKLPEDSNLKRPLEAILDSGKRAAEVVADMLTITRRAAAIKETISINQEIKSFLSSPEFVTLQQSHNKVIVTTNLDPELKAANCSTVHIRKCLLNLVVNAFEAIDNEGEITITTQNHNDTGADYVRITIADTGSGISETDQLHIFEPFYSKKTLGRSGTGLGLTVVWNSIEDHDGKIAVESNNNGTTFTIHLPATSEKYQTDPEKQNLILSETLAKYKGNQEKIIIVDDEQIQREIASELLSALNYQIQTAASGEAGIELLSRELPDLVLLDMLMDPGINGRQTYTRMSAISPGLRAVIASGFSENSEVEKALATGPSIFIKKPYTINQLGSVVKELLES
ncbi:transporter substrate-binding domain-containing protein [bacterium]|nr:transporter substrate-binding domain-containing protein [bacterium]